MGLDPLAVLQWPPDILQAVLDELNGTADDPTDFEGLAMLVTGLDSPHG